MLARMPHDETRKRHVLPDVAEVVDELASYNERMAHGTWVPPPGEDVLTQVLGTEHEGCTKGVGSHVGYKRGIPGYILYSKAEKEPTKKEIEVIQERMDARYKKREVEMEERHKQREMEMEKRHKHREMELEERYKQREMDL